LIPRLYFLPKAKVGSFFRLALLYLWQKWCCQLGDAVLDDVADGGKFVEG
jgi:hypothetical protein